MPVRPTIENGNFFGCINSTSGMETYPRREIICYALNDPTGDHFPATASKRIGGVQARALPISN